MALYKKTTLTEISEPWHKHGDHESVVPIAGRGHDIECDQCSAPTDEHGWIGTLEGGHRVCPGDRICTGAKGEKYPIKPNIFAATYVPAEASQ